MTEKKEKQYVIDNARLMEEWNWAKNDELGLDPQGLTIGSEKKAWWRCEKGHEWLASIANRNKGRGCAVCSNRRVLAGYNDLQTVNPQLASEWNYEKNEGLTPNEIMPNSGKKVWWKCRKGHEWQGKIINRNHGNGCPFCSGRYVVEGYTDLQTYNPSLAQEWNYERNENRRPETITANSNKKVWWKCSKGHEWQASVSNRSNGRGCPFCQNRKVLKGYNDLQTLNPELAQQWDYEENGNLYPDAVTANSNKSVWWICRKGHKWRTKINNRNNGNGCPVCNSERHTSYPEYAIIYYLRKNGLKPIHSYKGLGYELDIYIPSQKIAIEYDGYYWHRNKTKKDLDKNAKCNRDGITLYRIREGLLPLNDTSIDYSIDKNGKDLPQLLSDLLSRITGTSVDVDLNRDAVEIENLREYTEKECSILSANPQLAAEWNYEKNGNLKPEHFLPSSGKKVWWKCVEGHEWQALVSNRYKGIGCPYCSGKKPITGFNDLQTSNPSLAEEWDYEKNNGLSPTDVMPNSGKKVWWRCGKGHEWQARIADRNRGRRCPYCRGKKPE